jgi:septal ring factor EnvC (AmiA/AmiB activator)
MSNSITAEELKTIKEQQTELSTVVNQIGQLEANKHSLLHKIAGINEGIEDTKKQLEETYGAININLEDGTYTEIKKEDDGELAVVKAED